MKAKRFSYLLFSLVVALSFLFTACGQSANESSLDCPFTEMDWSSTTEDVFSAEGEDYSTYDSVYGGTTYTYPKEYLELEGTIKYMFDENEALMCVAWTYGSDSAEDLSDIYNTIHESVVDLHGESGYNAAHSTNYGDVWYLETGDIIISTMITDSNKVLQYSYLNPEVSNQGDSTEASATEATE